MQTLDLQQALEKNLGKIKSFIIQSMYNAMLGALWILKGHINLFSSFQPQLAYTTFLLVAFPILSTD